jgi:hypothetical protein
MLSRPPVSDFSHSWKHTRFGTETQQFLFPDGLWLCLIVRNSRETVFNEERPLPP